jgi:hypothetical protein
VRQLPGYCCPQIGNPGKNSQRDLFFLGGFFGARIEYLEFGNLAFTYCFAASLSSPICRVV